MDIRINNTTFINDIKKITVNDFKKKKNELFIIDISQKTENHCYILETVVLDNDGNKFIYHIIGVIPFFDIEENDITIEELNKNKILLKYKCIDELDNIPRIFLKPFNYYSNIKIPHLRLRFDNISNYGSFYKKLNENEKIFQYLKQNENSYSYYNKAIQYENLMLKEGKIPKKLLIMTWDIETHSINKQIPYGIEESDTCFLICGTFHNYNSDDIISSFAISTVKIKDKKNIGYPNLQLFICKNEKYLFIKFIKLINNNKPDIITGFNDHAYDWVYIKNKISLYYKDLKDDFFKCMNINLNNITNVDIFITSNQKIEAGYNTITIYPRSNCILFIDTRIIFKQIFPTENESNLNFYLNKMNLGGKEDLPYKKLFKIFENKDIVGMEEAVKYCLTDAFQCQQLLLKKQVLNEQYNMAILTGTILKNVIVRANGFKVFNLLLKEGKNEYSFSFNKVIENNVSFEGGLVIDPIFGINLDLPVVGLDFNSLYPNIQRTLNLGPDTLIRPNDIELFNNNSEIKIKKICNNYVVDHDGKEKNMSIMVKILTMLFNKRKIIKNIMLSLESHKEKYGKKTLSDALLNDLNSINKYTEEDDLDYIISDLDKKQLIIKVIMNTFYGLQGSKFSNISCKEVAEIITYTGRNLTTDVRNFIKDENKYIIYYGDTDSIYVSCQKNIFKEIEESFLNNKISVKKLFKKKIDITKSEIMLLKDKINQYLKKKFIYSYLTMAFERNTLSFIVYC